MFCSEDDLVTIDIPTLYPIKCDKEYEIFLTLDREDLSLGYDSYCASGKIITLKGEHLTLSFGGLIGRFSIENNVSVEIIKNLLLDAIDTPFYLQIKQSESVR